MIIPTISELKTQIENDLRSELGITTTWFGKVFLRVLATVQAGKIKLIYLAIALVQKNIFVDTCDAETLNRFGLVKIGRVRYPAAAGVYTIDITGVVGGIVPDGAQYKSTINSTSPEYLFIVETGTTLVATSGQIVVRALTPGAISGLVALDEIELTAPIENINSLAYVNAVTTTPVAAETVEQFRDILIQAFQLEPQGGATTDYRQWSLDVEGVRTSYAYTKNGETFAVQVYVEALPDDSEPGQPEGVPPTSMLEDVEEVIELDPDTTKPLYQRGRRPLGVYNLEVISVVPVGVTIRIYNLTDDSAPVLSAISEACIELFYDIRPYIAGADGENRNDVLYQSQVISAVTQALGNTIFFSNLEMVIDSSVVTSYAFGQVPATFGEYPYLELLENLT